MRLLHWVQLKGSGLLLCLAIAVPAWWLGGQIPLIGGPVFAILTGMLSAPLVRRSSVFKPGIQFSAKKILQLAVVLLGFGLNLRVIASVGAASLPIILSTILTALAVSALLRRWLRMDGTVAVLVGVGSSICGGSAIAAAAPVIQAEDDDIAQAISVIFLFNVIAALLFPALGELIGLSHAGFGLFAGTAVNDTSSVTAAASAWDAAHGTGTMVLDTATIVKLTRTLAIIPITLALSVRTAHHSRTAAGGAAGDSGSVHLGRGTFSLKRVFPMFILWFVLAAAATTLFQSAAAGGLLSADVSAAGQFFFAGCKQVSKFCIVTAMAAIGLNTNFVKLVRSGGKPILQGLICWVAIAAVSLGMQRLLGLM